MPNITDNLDKVGLAMENLPDEQREALGDLLKNMAVDAIMAGIGGPKWEAYMRLFADNQEQLDRLNDASQDEPWLREERAYIVTNAMCTVDTNTRTRLGLNENNQIDDGLPTNEDPAIKNSRPALFKNLVP